MFQNKKGFTLVELIVVIAIIAILASVSIIGFGRFIDNAKWSNDSNKAAQMTRIVKTSGIGLLDFDYEVEDVRTIIELNHGKPFDFTPDTDEAAFVYRKALNEVVIVKIDDVLSGDVELDVPKTENLLLSSSTLDGFEPIYTPEEALGSGTFMLSEAGSTLAEFVVGIRNLTEAADLGAAYGELVTRASNLGDGEFKTLVNNVLGQFDPDTTLYVNSDSDLLNSLDTANIERIIFAEGATNEAVKDLEIEDEKLLTQINRLIKYEYKSDEGDEPSGLDGLAEIELRFGDETQLHFQLNVSDFNLLDYIDPDEQAFFQWELYFVGNDGDEEEEIGFGSSFYFPPAMELEDLAIDIYNENEVANVQQGPYRLYLTHICFTSIEGVYRDYIYAGKTKDVT
jgi:prepilin-type N-terminal cleavage/methylation domain-containing protein